MTAISRGCRAYRRCIAAGQPKIHATQGRHAAKESYVDGDDCQHQVKGYKLIPTLCKMHLCQALSGLSALFEGDQSAECVVGLPRQISFSQAARTLGCH